MPADKATELIAQILEGMALIDADRALDDARRFAFSCVFEGGDQDELGAALDCSDEARAIASAMSGLHLHEVVDTLETARMAAWRARYNELPESRYGRAIRAIAKAGAARLN